MSMLKTISLVILLWTVASVMFGLVAGRFFALTWNFDDEELRVPIAPTQDEADNIEGLALSAPPENLMSAHNSEPPSSKAA